MAVSFGDSASRVVIVDEYVAPNVDDVDRPLLHELANDRAGSPREKVSLTESVFKDSEVDARGVDAPDDTRLPTLSSEADPSSSLAPSKVAGLTDTGEGFDVVPNCRLLAVTRSFRRDGIV